MKLIAHRANIDGPDWDSLRVVDCYGICTDFVEKLK